MRRLTLISSDAQLRPLATAAPVRLDDDLNILSPGSVQTDAWDAFPDKERRLAEAIARSPLGRLVSLDEVAHAAQFLCSAASTGPR